jgi:putative thioredoxin
MKSSDYIIDVTETDFEYQVIAYSQQTPVVVDFWANWCVPCKALSPVLEKLAKEGNGAFRLARIDVDANPNLAVRFNVRGIPAVKAFRDGQVVSEFTGLQPEVRVRDFIRALAPSKADLLLEKAHTLLDMRQPASAEKEFRRALDESPDNPAALLGLIKSLLLQGRVGEAEPLLNSFPASKEFGSAENLHPLAEAMGKMQKAASSGNDPLEPAYANALRLAGRGNVMAAMDGLLDILRQDKHYQHDEARRVMVALFELLKADDPLTRQYRNEFASVLF